MTRIFFCFFFLLISAGTLQAQPNVLMIAVDDLRPMLGCYGDNKIKTPHIDELAGRGMLFENAYCQYAKCGTSRLSLMTGLRPDSIGVFSNNLKDVTRFRKKNPNIKSLGQWFRENGYYTRGFGKIYHDTWDNPADWSEPASPGREKEMLEIVDPENPTGPTIIAERLACPVKQAPDVPDEHLFAGRMTEDVVSLLKNYSDEKPWFFAVGYRRPHLPFVAPKKYYDLYQPDKSWLPKNPNPPKGSPYLAWFNSDGYIGSAKRVGLTMPNPPSRSEAIDWNGYEMRSYLDVPYHGEIKEQEQIDLIHAYAACVSYVDAQIGKLVEALSASGKLDETLIVLWSDHGWHLGEMSAWGKMTNYEIATRVPLIFAGPGVAKGKTNSMAELVDLFPSLCEMCEIDSPDHLEGESLKDVLSGSPSDEDSFALSQYSRYKGNYTGRAIRTAHYRYVEWSDKSGKVINREFFDHQSDPDETINIADQRKEEVEKASRKLKEAFE